MRDPFAVLGLTRNCTQAEAQERYYALREQYKRDRFLEGEAGNIAAKKLQELEDAYTQVLDELSSGYTFESKEDNYARVASAVRNGNLREAQSCLDAMNTRDAEWHYYQALVYYKQDSFVECRKQLQMAITLDGDNEKYQQTLKKLEAKMNANNPFNSDTSDDNATHDRSYTDPAYTTSRSDGENCCRICNALICIDCCCEMMGGDCITCC